MLLMLLVLLMLLMLLMLLALLALLKLLTLSARVSVKIVEASDGRRGSGVPVHRNCHLACAGRCSRKRLHVQGVSTSAKNNEARIKNK